MKKVTLYRKLYDYLGSKKVPYIVFSVLCILFGSLFVLTYSYLYKLFFNSMEYQDISRFKDACILCVNLYCGLFQRLPLLF